MEYRAVTKEDPKNELTHWKYIDREKKNGKWRYTYDKQKVDKVVNYAKQESTREAQNLAYDTANEALKYRQNTTDDAGEYLARTIQRGYVGTLKILNNIGKGTLDDSLNSFMNKAYEKINELFKKIRDQKTVIKEKKIPETVIKEKKIPETVIKEKRF